MAKEMKMSRVDDDSRVVELVTKDNELAAEERQLDQSLSDINSGIASASRQKSIDEAATELLADGMASLVGLTELHEQREAVNAKMRVVRRAREIIRKDLQAARADASRRIATLRKPEYVGTLRKLKTAVETALAVATEEESFRDRALQDGVSMSDGALYPMRLDTEALISWLAEAREFYGL